MNAVPQAAFSILRRPQVKARTGLSKTSIYDKINPKSPYYDASFPAPVSLGGRSVGWRLHEVDAWIASRLKKSGADAAAMGRA